MPGAGGNIVHPLVSTFAILASPVISDETCHFCLQPCDVESIEDDPYFQSPFAPLVMKLKCCGHYVHCKCFMNWALAPLNEYGLHCAYCRATYNYAAKCFLCLEELGDLPTKYTSCCGSKVHPDCADALVSFCQTHLTSEYTLECGQLYPCACLWKAA